LSLEDDIKAKGFPSMEEKTYVNLIFTAFQLESRFNQFIKSYELSTEQYKVLRILRGQYPEQILSGDIQAHMLKAMSNSTRLVDKLVEKNLVDRTASPDDKRQIMVRITQQGLDLLISLDLKVANLFKDMIKSDKAHLIQLNGLLDEMRDLSS
jgi:DNA-binding MarR family transcriptional regulator|tara:strand:+ start:65 stop:523 length:459 start_codon:yes stop_codon:yes gene_type:complete